jgi:two-component system KDP operon response regulator KdpE
MAEPIKVLVIDDEPQIRRFLRISLSTEGMRVLEAGTAREGLAACRTEAPDLVVLDLGLPDADGLSLIPQLRQFSAVPVVVLSVRDHESAKVQALEAGADDYVVKPFGTAEFIARLRAALRHGLQAQGAAAVVSSGALRIDLARRQVWLEGAELKLSRKEYEILSLLARHAGKVVTQAHLLREIWGKAQDANTQYLRVYVGHLRDKLGDDAVAPRYIETLPGVGYRLRSEAADGENVR